jgi:alkyldihydroxyacetonephosphate synthase
VREALGEPCHVSCRLTHTYPDGAAPYFTVLAPARRGAELDQWDRVKAVATDAVVWAGGTVTHHHAVGRDHRPGYDRQRPEPFAAALRAVKGVVDPAGRLNPGVLVDS